MAQNSNYEETLANHQNLIELGKQLNVKETISKNQKQYLDKVLNIIDENNYLEIEENIDLIESYDSNIEKIKKYITDNYMQSDIVYIEDEEELLLNILSLFYFSNILLKNEIVFLSRELELANDTKESVDEQYEEVIEELDEKEKELKLVNDNFNRFKFNCAFLFMFYNYMIYFSTDEIKLHFEYVIGFILLCFSFILSNWSNFIILIIGTAGVGNIYERMCKYKND